MGDFTKEDKEEAKKLVEFFVDLLEHNTSNVKYYLAENAVLDWFGKTVRDEKVSIFLNSTVSKVTHHLDSTVPAENVTFRESHIVKVPKNAIGGGIFSPISADPMVTPPTNTQQPSTSSVEMGQGDGTHNSCVVSPPKRQKLELPTQQVEENETVEDESDEPKLKYLTAEGAVEFHRPSVKKFQPENKWKRPVKLHIGYTVANKEHTIYLIIYEGNVKCRRNLYSEFCEAEKLDAEQRQQEKEEEEDVDEGAVQ